MYDEDDEQDQNIIEMYQHREPIEVPTNGLEEFIDWDGLERKLAAGEFSCQRDFRAEVTAMFEAAKVPFSHHYYRSAVKGLFPEFHALYSALPAHAMGVAA
jgi:hypothetical protein